MDFPLARGMPQFARRCNPWAEPAPTIGRRFWLTKIEPIAALATLIDRLQDLGMSGGDPVLLDRTLRPSPPMSPTALLWIVVAVALINLGFASVFVWRGAWLVTPFMGLDVALLAWAFRASLRAARARERVLLTRSKLTVERHPSKGPASEVALNPYWVRVDMADPPEPGSQLMLWSHGKGVRVGAFLGPDEKLALARTLKSALRRARETIPV